MTLLYICQQAAAIIGLEAIQSVASSTNRTSRRLHAAANRSGRALSRRAAWQSLLVEHTFVTVAAETQTDDPVPDDFDSIVTETAFNRSSSRELAGPLTPQEWQRLKAATAQVTPTDSFRIRGWDFIISPTPSAGDTIAYEYVSKYWVDSGPAPDGILDASKFAHDLDEPTFDEEMMILDVVWRYEKGAGLPYAEDFRSAELMIADRITKDGAGKRRIQLIGRNGRRRMPPTIDEGNWTL